MAASLFASKRPLMVRASSSKNSNPYMAMNKITPPSTPHVPDMIIPGLYLTDLFTARQTLLPTYPSPHRPHIKYILSLLDNSLSQPHPKPESRASLFEQRLVLIDDTPDADILVHLTPLCDWISTCLTPSPTDPSHPSESVLIHCHMGQSRSATIVIAYLLRLDPTLTVTRAIDRVKHRRPVVRPNVGFVRQLELWKSMDFDVWEEVETEVEEVGVDGEKKTEKRKVRRRKREYEEWKGEMERRTKRYLENLT